jgi:hypothetical protein
MITANRRASATIAFFIPRCLATFIAQALSQDHFVERTSIREIQQSNQRNFGYINSQNLLDDRFSRT